MSGSAGEQPPSEGAAFALGAATVLVVLALVLGFVALRIGPGELAARLGGTLADATVSYGDRVLDLPEEVREELTELEAVIGNAGNPTGAREHDTLLVRPDPDHGFVLRPGRRLLGFNLRAKNSWNLDPPVLALLEESPRSPRLDRWLAEQARTRFVYTIDDEGFRVSEPEVETPSAILAIGDSVMFGTGVDDHFTLASQLQQALGNRIRVVNAGIGSYTGPQAVARARELLREGQYSGLVYYTAQNDFYQGGGEDDPVAFVDGLLGGLADLRPEISGGPIAVSFVPWIQHCVGDVVGAGKRKDARLDFSAAVYAALPGLASWHGVHYVDWNRICEEYGDESGSIFARMGLYVDHGHPSRLGHRLAAKRLAEPFRAALDAAP